MEREQTSIELIELGIRLHLAGSSLSNISSELEKFGVQRSRNAVHDWVHEADLQPADAANPDHVALNETVIQVNGQGYWLYADVNPETNRFLTIKLSSTYTTGLTELFLSELREKHDVSDVVFLVDDADWLQPALQRHGLDFRYECHGNQNAAKRVLREVKRRTSSFSNSFSHIDPKTAELWLQGFAVWHNSIN